MCFARRFHTSLKTRCPAQSVSSSRSQLQEQESSMPKMKWYAVKVGRGGPNIYTTWEECNAQVARWPGAKHKSFNSKASAEQWLADTPRLSPTPLSAKHGWQEQSIASDSAAAAPWPADSLQSVEAPALPPLALAEPPAPISLSKEQRDVLEKVRQGKSVFFTGSAGTGKSVLLREILKICPKPAGITASTGLAGVNIGGTTLHFWAGIGLGSEPKQKLADKIRYQSSLKDVRKRWINVRTLVIDEISMLDGGLWDKLEFIARSLRENNMPFGGIQLVVSGDFAQLPPVPNRVDNVPVPIVFAFDAESWNACLGRPITLIKVFRQKDQGFVDMLNSMRLGRISVEMIDKFQQLSRPVTYTDGIEPTELFPTKGEVNRANAARLKALPEPAHVYTSRDTPGTNSSGFPLTKEQAARILERLVVNDELTLKVGAQVMLVKNLVQGRLVNGSVGHVVAFRTGLDAKTNRTAISDADPNPAPNGKPPVESEAVRSDRLWPVVKFTNGMELLCVPAEFSVENAFGTHEASRDQVPLILAYALSIHKSQGQTLDRVKVDLHRIFEKGQAYVALSRATSLDTLEVLNFNPSKVVAHPRVLEWQEMLDQEAASREAEDLDDMDDEEAMAAYYNN